MSEQRVSIDLDGLIRLYRSLRQYAAHHEKTAQLLQLPAVRLAISDDLADPATIAELEAARAIALHDMRIADEEIAALETLRAAHAAGERFRVRLLPSGNRTAS